MFDVSRRRSLHSDQLDRYAATDLEAYAARVAREDTPELEVEDPQECIKAIEADYDDFDEAARRELREAVLERLKQDFPRHYATNRAGDRISLDTYLLTSDSFRAEQLLPPLQDAQHEAQLRELGELQEGVHRRRLVRRDLFRAPRDRVGDAPLPRRVNSRGNINSLSTQSSPQRREGAASSASSPQNFHLRGRPWPRRWWRCGARRRRNARG